jgi:hypothetical protein
MPQMQQRRSDLPRTHFASGVSRMHGTVATVLTDVGKCDRLLAGGLGERCCVTVRSLFLRRRLIFVAFRFFYGWSRRVHLSPFAARTSR